MVKVVRNNGAKKPTPYLRKYFSNIIDKKSNGIVVDIGCGNGRNSKPFVEKGYDVIPFDYRPDFKLAKKWSAIEMIPVKNHTVNIILCQYILCFLNKEQIYHVLSEINRMANDKCFLIIEIEDVKNGNRLPLSYMIELLNSICISNWEAINITKKHCLLQLTSKVT